MLLQDFKQLVNVIMQAFVDWWCLKKQADWSFSKRKKSVFKSKPHCLTGALRPGPCPSQSFLGTQALWEKTEIPIPTLLPISSPKVNKTYRLDKYIFLNVAVAFSPSCGRMLCVCSFLWYVQFVALMSSDKWGEIWHWGECAPCKDKRAEVSADFPPQPGFCPEARDADSQ